MIPPDLLDAGVMLATAGKDPDNLLKQQIEEGHWTWDIKWDGVRVLVYVDQGVVLLRNRNGVDITHRYPEMVVHLREAFPVDTLVFDGEMLVFDLAKGRPTFDLIARRDAQSNPKTIAQLAEAIPASFMAFDLLYDNGADLRRVMQVGRHMLLTKVAERFDGKRMLLTQFSEDGEAMWKQVHALNLEGLIAKKRSSVYTPGRQSAWVKLKPTHSFTAIVTGWEHGKKGGARANMIGALFLGLIDETGSAIKDVGKVGTGFTMKELADLEARFAAWKDDPGSNPPLLVEVEYQELTTDGKLRFPSYKGLRQDVTFADCTVKQLETA